MSEAVAHLPNAESPPRRRMAGFTQAALLAAPALFLLLFSVTPILLLLRISLSHHEEGQLVASGFDLAQYRQLADPIFLRAVLISLALAALTSALTLAIAFPAVFFISRMRRRAQVAWLVFILGALSLSEVLVVFAFQVLLSSSGVLVEALTGLHLMASPHSLYPNLGAVTACLVYLVLPYVMLFLYPAVSKLDAEMPQAAATMGASPIGAFFRVTTPLMRGPLASAAALVAIFTVSSYLTPLVLGRPETWTVGVQLSNTAMEAVNMPLAAAQAVALVAAMVGLLALVRRIGAERTAK
ncbi:MAG: ABC transporter permease subunit [Caulobacteraceae bacterium]|nr:ABC transporter permease subunit [Caulobacteraceae bacterium]